jgi:ectoine hydroxylase-related dioxygenase (phytanoyl-CoA dioxygenase family)
LLDTAPLRALLAQLFPAGCQLVKAIYFDKPALSNWLVAWHQDLMINVDGRTEQPGFGPWTSKPEGASVQPPVAVLENMCTIRIHLDDCDAGNGALKAVAGTHRQGVLLPAALPALTPAATVCAVPAGGAMLMRPLLLHASNRSTSPRPRRVVHLEFASAELPSGLRWRERRPWPDAGKQP